jgi:hypothetical protein
VVPAGGLSLDHTRWIQSHPKFFLPVDVLAEVFRGKFTQALEEAFAQGKLGFSGSMKPFARPKVFTELVRLTFRKKWIVYAKRPFGGAEHALRYLGCYTHRVAISNHRLTAFENDQVTFRWRDSAHKNKQRLMTLHVNVRIRHFGFLSTRNRSTLLPLCFRLLAGPAAAPTTPAVDHSQQHQRITWLCPQCNGPMLILERMSALQLRFRAPPNLNPKAA